MIRAVFGAAIALALAACSAPVRNVELAQFDPRAGYRLHNLDHGTQDDTLIVMTLSGGGTRAAALAVGALRGLHTTTMNGAPLDTEIDVVSSVSGGSVTAAYFALHGHAGLKALEDGFLYQNVMGDLFANGLNPANLARLPTPSYSRIDWLVASFRDRLFPGGETYRTLFARDTRQPYLILNAGDVTAETVFPFTQERFDLICSDLLEMRLAEAVAASAAFPVALTALTLKNYSPCPAQDAASSRDFPPRWIIGPLSTSAYDSSAGRRRAAREWSYLNRAYPDDYLDAEGNIDGSGPPFGKNWRQPAAPEDRRHYVHLLDGGIADNLGLSEPLHMLSSTNAPFMLRGPRGKQPLQAICDGDIRKVMFVIVNARSDRQSKLDRRATPPGIVSMLTGTTNSAIDGTTYGLVDRLDTVLKDLVALSGRCEATGLAVFSVPVDFAFIDDPACRRRFENIATSWRLDDEEVSALIEVGNALVRRGLTQKAPGVDENGRPRLSTAAETLGLWAPPGDSGPACRRLADHVAQTG